MGETVNQYLSKGRQVLVEGRLNPDPETGSPRVYQRQDGSWGAQYELTALSVKFLGGRAEGAGPGAPGELDEPPADLDLDADSIPF
jgi:single-strand DNA-binding protein